MPLIRKNDSKSSSTPTRQMSGLNETPRASKAKKVSFTGRVIRVLIGPTAEEHCVHEAMLQSSNFIKAALSGEWAESRSGVVKMEDATPEVFSTYTQWLYQGVIATQDRDMPIEDDEEYFELARAYVLGDRLQDADFKDAVIDCMIAKSEEKKAGGSRVFPRLDVVQHIYENTVEGSRARKVMVDLYCRNARGNGTWLQPEGKDGAPHDFLYDLAASLIVNRGPPDERILLEKNTACMYHEHGGVEGNTCYKARYA